MIRVVTAKPDTPHKNISMPENSINDVWIMVSMPINAFVSGHKRISESNPVTKNPL